MRLGRSVASVRHAKNDALVPRVLKSRQEFLRRLAAQEGPRLQVRCA